MLFTQIENGQAKYHASMIAFFVEKGIIESVNATAEELVNASIVPVTQFTGQLPVDGYQYAIEVQQQEDDSWAQVMVQIEISEERYLNNVAVQTQVVKADRDRMIASTDWIVTKSIEEGTSVSQAWKDFRQALRDIPEQEGFPFNVTWPTLPV